MVEITGVYEGEKHCELVHGPSLKKIQTDAPRDNNGKGEAFSPTDLVGAALGSCILTTMGIYGDAHGIDIKGSTFKVVKEMASNPRRIASLSVEVHLPETLSEKDREVLERVGNMCPVKVSLHPEVNVPVKYIYSNL
jgi:putative redox protein